MKNRDQRESRAWNEQQHVIYREIYIPDKFDGNLEDSVEIVKGMTYTVTFPDVNEYCIVCIRMQMLGERVANIWP